MIALDDGGESVVRRTKKGIVEVVGDLERRAVVLLVVLGQRESRNPLDPSTFGRYLESF